MRTYTWGKYVITIGDTDAAVIEQDYARIESLRAAAEEILWATEDAAHEIMEAEASNVA